MSNVGPGVRQICSVLRTGDLFLAVENKKARAGHWELILMLEKCRAMWRLAFENASQLSKTKCAHGACMVCHRGTWGPSSVADFDFASFCNIPDSNPWLPLYALHALLIELLCCLLVFILLIYPFIAMNPRPPRVRYLIHLSPLSFQIYSSNSNHPPCRSWSFEGSQNTINGYERIWVGQEFELVKLVHCKSLLLCPYFVPEYLYFYISKADSLLQDYQGSSGISFAMKRALWPFLKAYLSRFRYHLFGAQWRRVKIPMHLQRKDAIAWSCNDNLTPSYYQQRTKGQKDVEQTGFSVVSFLVYYRHTSRVFPFFWRASNQARCIYRVSFDTYASDLPSFSWWFAIFTYVPRRHAFTFFFFIRSFFVLSTFESLSRRPTLPAFT